MPATAERCAVCGVAHRKPEVAAKCAARAGSSSASAAVTPLHLAPQAPAQASARDIIDVLTLRDGRLVLGRNGGVLPVAPSIPGYGALPRQVVSNQQVVGLMVELSGADPDEVVRGLNQYLRNGWPLTDLIPPVLLEWTVHEVNLLVARAERLANQTSRSAA